jgi:hypothetical protein
MRRILILATILLMSGAAAAQQPATPVAGAPVKMPAEYSAKVSELQQQADKLDKDYGQVVTLFKEYAAKRDAIQAQAAVLITRAALAVHMTIEQLDNSTLAIDDKGAYQWVPKAKAPAAKQANAPN